MLPLAKFSKLIKESKKQEPPVLTTFLINELKYNEPISLLCKNNTHLSHISNTCISSEIPKKWVLVPDMIEPLICYIQTIEQIPKYVGCPASKNTYLYATKCRFTKWKIVQNGDVVNIEYAGDKFDVKDVQIVIARSAKDDISWTEPYSDICVIYNKGLPLNTYQHTNLTNIGGKEHTYLHHIITNYNTLANWTIFIPSNPFMNNETILHGIENYDRFDPVMPLGMYIYKERNIPPVQLVQKLKVTTPYGLEYVTLKMTNDYEYANDNIFDDWGIGAIRAGYKYIYKPSIPIIDNFLHRALLKIASAPILNTSVGGMFAASRDKIKKFSITDYTNLMQELLHESNQGGHNKYILERIWIHMLQ